MKPKILATLFHRFTRQKAFGKTALLACLLTSSPLTADVITIDPIISPDNPPSNLQIVMGETNLAVSWTGEGVLQSAHSLDGPWTGVTQMSPYDIVPAQGVSMMFYRVSSRYNRPATVRLPAGYQPTNTYPLVVGLHGYSFDVSSLDLAFPVEPLADAYGFIYVKPVGIRDSTGRAFWNATDACCAYEDGSVSDSTYLRRLIDSIKEVCSVDERRVYVLGYSNGGFMAHRMGCDHADAIAAIVSYAGATFLDMAACAPVEPVNVLEIHGTADIVILYGGGTYDARGGAYPGAVQTATNWGTLNGCTSFGPVAGSEFDLVSGIPGLETSVSTFTQCPSGAMVDLWTIQGGGHWEILNGDRIIQWLYAHPKP